MDVFLTIAGLIAAVSLFLYFINAVDSGKRAVSKKIEAYNSSGKSTAVINEQPVRGVYGENGNPPAQNAAAGQCAASRLPDELKDLMPSRRCPLCSSTLTRDEPLYASNIEVGGERKILIYGCPYCHKWEKKNGNKSL